MTIEQLYRDWSAGDPAARELLAQQHWFSCLADFDPLTAEALPQALGAVLRKPVSDEAGGVVRDRLWRLVEHARASMEKLFRELNESPRREHAVLPLRAVRELDTASFMALSRRPGRTIREKLAGKPYMQAVRHFQSIDLPENRLLKALAERLQELLELRTSLFGEAQDREDGFRGLLETIQSWLASDEAGEIGRWDNLPPNNTLLTHRDYRAVYDAWCWLQTLDDDLVKDAANRNKRRKAVLEWTKYREMYAAGKKRGFLFAEMPVTFDYDHFEISAWTENPIAIPAEGCGHPAPQDPVPAPDGVCVDLTDLFPRFSVADAGTKTFSAPFAWQQWQKESESVDIDLFRADAACLHADAATVTAPDLFFSAGQPDFSRDPALLERAARVFAEKLRETFETGELVWLVPDALNDFELDIIRRNLNACFPEAEPLPRSVAAVFEKTDFSKLHPGHAVVVLDSVGGRLCATKLEAKRDEKLARRLPETNGFYWEHHPTVLLQTGDLPEHPSAQTTPFIQGMATVDENGNWMPPLPKPLPVFGDETMLRNDKRIGNFQRIINLAESPVQGGIRLHAWQKRAGDIPLWRDRIPELSIKVKAHGVYRRISLVARGTTVHPIRGIPVVIPVKNDTGQPTTFTLPMGRNNYLIPLYIGENDEQLGFSAQLRSKDFPLGQDTECDLELTFTYGADDPYCLVFKPRNSALRPIRAIWERTKEEIVTNASAPIYPNSLDWEKLRHFSARNGKEVSDLLKWAQTGTEWQIKELSAYPEKRFTGRIASEWLTDKKGLSFTFAECDELGSNVFIHEKQFMIKGSHSLLDIDDSLTFGVREEADGRYTGIHVAQENFTNEDCDNAMERRFRALYVPVIRIWRDGRSIYTSKCPSDFAKTMKDRILRLRSLLDKDTLPDSIKREIRFLLSCMHRDAPDEIVQWLTGQVNSWKSHERIAIDLEGADYDRMVRAVGFALGDLSQVWQKRLFKMLVSKPNPNSLRALAYAIWRDKHVVEHFSLSNLQAVLEALSDMLEDIARHPKNEQEGTDQYLDWGHTAREAMELLLGLLRTRSSSNPEIRMVLQPHQKITKELDQCVGDVAAALEKERFRLTSRVRLGKLGKHKDDPRPDLVYALQLYLTGDDGANAIEITGISDTGDNDDF